MYLVSACLIGINCRYDGKSSFSEEAARFLSDKRFVPTCPELLGGLGVPRRPCRFSGGDGQQVLAGSARVVDDTGNDLTDRFVTGAEQTLSIVLQWGVTRALLNERSPSCGVNEVYIGDEKTPGMGVTAALLKREGIVLISDEDI